MDHTMSFIIIGSGGALFLAIIYCMWVCVTGNYNCCEDDDEFQFEYRTNTTDSDEPDLHRTISALHAQRR